MKKAAQSRPPGPYGTLQKLRPDGSLRPAVPGISKRTLSSTLKNLERDGLVIGGLFPEVLPRVEYEITDLGKSLLRPTQGLVDWAKANWEQVRQAQS